MAISEGPPLKSFWSAGTRHRFSLLRPGAASKATKSSQLPIWSAGTRHRFSLQRLASASRLQSRASAEKSGDESPHSIMYCITILTSLFVPLAMQALEVEPWIGDIWEWNLRSNYTYSRFTHVQQGHPQLKHPFNDQRLAFSLEVPPSDTWDAEVEIEFVNTPRQSWGMRSVAGQLRYLFLNDVEGDPISLTGGLSVRGVSRHSLHDVSCPYHSDVNIECNASLGKEWSRTTVAGTFWHTHAFAFAGIGIANHGSLWLRALAAVKGNYRDKHQYQLFADTYWGLGSQRTVYVDRFNGYGKIHHQSVDLGAGYTYLFDIWGTLNFGYAFRVYARSFPEYVNFFSLTYTFPFSFF